MSISLAKVDLIIDKVSILKNINLNINSGERILLVGINGSGKTALLRTIAGMHLISNGSISVGKMQCIQDQCNGLAYLGDNWGKTVAYTGYQLAYQSDIMVKNMMTKIQSKYPKRRDELIEVLNINLEWKMHLVSSGQRRRVRLFLGLIKPFKIALIDEMTMDLDIIIRKRFMNWLKKESIDNNATIIYATHIFDCLDNWSTHLLHINNGELDNKIEINNCNYFEKINKLLHADYKGKSVEETDKSLNIGYNEVYKPYSGYESGRLKMHYS